MATKTTNKDLYTFEAGNATVDVSVVGEYRNSCCKDIRVDYQGDAEWFCNGTFIDETDDACDAFQWLADEGVLLGTDRELAFHLMWVQHVMIEGDATEEELAAESAGWPDGYVAEKVQWIER